MSTKRRNVTPVRRQDGWVDYDYKGTRCSRRLPEFVRQTLATREAANRFGIASRTGRFVRQAFAPYLQHNRHDGTWVNRLNSRLLASGIEGLKRYRFINKTNITQFLGFNTMGEDRQLHIRNFFMPRDKDRKVTHMEIRLIAVRLDLNTGRIYDTKTEAYRHDVKKPFEAINFDTHLPGKGSLLVALQVSPYQHTDHLEDQYFMATDIIVVEPAPPETPGKKQRGLLRRQAQKEASNQPGVQQANHLSQAPGTNSRQAADIQQAAKKETGVAGHMHLKSIPPSKYKERRE